MKTIPIISTVSQQTALTLCLILLTGCSTVSIDAAKALSVTGKNIAVQTQQNIFVSDNEYLRARDSEALFHGLTGTAGSESYKVLLASFNDAHQELSKRRVIFEKLTDVYNSFGDLVGLEASKDTEAALGNLGGAINDYAVALSAPPPLVNNTTAVISKIGGLISDEIQKAKIKEASTQIRINLKAFSDLLESPLVREQFLGFKQFLAIDRKVAIIKLWKTGLLDPTPLINDIGTDISLIAQKDAATKILTNKAMQIGLEEVIDKRLAYKTSLIEQGYDASLASIKKLIIEHEKLENGNELDLASLREIVSKLRGIAILLSTPKAVTTTAP